MLITSVTGKHMLTSTILNSAIPDVTLDQNVSRIRRSECTRRTELTYLLSPLRVRWHIRQSHSLSTQLGDEPGITFLSVSVSVVDELHIRGDWPHAASVAPLADIINRFVQTKLAGNSRGDVGVEHVLRKNLRVVRCD